MRRTASDPLSPDRLHLVASASGCGLLKQASQKHGWNIHPSCVEFPFSLAGPINVTHEFATRMNWLVSHRVVRPASLHQIYPDLRISGAEIDAVAAQLFDESIETTFWMSSRSQSDVTILTQVCHRRRTLDQFMIIDVEDAVQNGALKGGLGACNVDALTEAVLHARTLTIVEIEHYRHQYSVLEKEQLPLRQLSAPKTLMRRSLDSFDEDLKRTLSAEWQDVRHLFADQIALDAASGLANFNHLLTLERLFALISAGATEQRGGDPACDYGSLSGLGEIRPSGKALSA